MTINEDIGRETEIMMAKLQPYDGSTVYSNEDPDIEFMGYELKPYRVYRRASKSWAVGTTITRHTRVKTVFKYQAPVQPAPHYYITPGLEDEYNRALVDEEIERGTSYRARAARGEY